MRSRFFTFISLLISFLLGGLLVYLLLMETPLFQKGVYNYVNNGVVSCDDEVTIDETGISLSVGKVYDSVVMIENIQGTTLDSTGSGFIYKKDDQYGYIMTNQHVVAGASSIVVVMSNNEEVEGRVLGSDPYLDLAVVRIPVDAVYAVATLGNSEGTNLGDTIFTVGAPLGYEYRGSITRGTMSGKNRLVTVDVSTTADYVMKVLQVDAAVNRGNSGGPLCNINGEVIGVISLKLVDDDIEGMGFAIPIEDAMTYVDSLEKGEAIERPLMGVTMANVSDTYLLLQNGITLDDNISSGVVVISVSGGAEMAGLQKGDVIVKMNDEVVPNAAYLKYFLFKHAPGDVVTVTYYRDGAEHQTDITLTKSEN